MEYLQTTSDIKGRLIKYKLPLADSVMAVHEAVVNSIQANATKIEVILEKTNEKTIEGISRDNIKSITIIDNGDGFTQENFDSFKKVDSTYKLDKGGKGIGRLAWLKVFNHVTIESNYRENSNYYYKRFEFSSIPGKEIGIEEDKISDIKQHTTKITLSKINDSYHKSFPKKISTLSNKILYHNLMYFMTSDSFDIIIKESGKEDISLRNIYDETIKGKKRTLDFKIKEHGFTLNYLTIEDKSIKDKYHKLKLTANEREVKEINLKEYNPMFEEPFEHEFILAYLEGTYLDDNVTDDRTDFTINGRGSLFTTIKDISEKVSEELVNVYSEEFNVIKEKNKERITDFLKENPSFRYIYNANPAIAEQINDKFTNEKLEDIFYTEAKSIRNDLNKQINDFNFEGDYQEEFTKLTSNLKQLNEYDLSQYVLHRKVILTILDKLISKKLTDDKYYLEEDLHNLIFPMRKNGDEVNYQEHNLWLVDDRLSYYNFLSSDLPFTKICKDSNDRTRPDLAIYRAAYSDKPETEVQDNITIIELKRPDRTKDLTYSVLKDQVINYRDRFIESTIKSDLRQRPIQAQEGRTKFHIYIICEITPKLKKELVKRESFKETPDGLGCFRYYEEMQTMLEVITFDKLFNDATNRNKIFFKKLGIE